MTKPNANRKSSDQFLHLFSDFVIRCLVSITSTRRGAISEIPTAHSYMYTAAGSSAGRFRSKITDCTRRQVSPTDCTRRQVSHGYFLVLYR